MNWMQWQTHIRKSEQKQRYLEDCIFYPCSVLCQLNLQLHDVSASRSANQSSTNISLGLIQRAYIPWIFIMIDNSLMISCSHSPPQTVSDATSKSFNHHPLINQQYNIASFACQRLYKLYGVLIRFIQFLMQGSEQLKELITRKDQLEKELAKLTQSIELLDQTKSFNKGLVDAEGFPRNDLDFGELCNYRNLKRRKAELNNDHLALMKQIQVRLHELHAPLLSTSPATWTSQTSQSKNTNIQVEAKVEKLQKQEKVETKIDYLTPFAKISLVEPSSPAQKSGLKLGDLLSEFGQVMIYSLDWMKQIPTIVKEGVPIKVIVMRKATEGETLDYPSFELKDKNRYYRIELFLVPARWEGKGLLGCKIDPF